MKSKKLLYVRMGSGKVIHAAELDGYGQSGLDRFPICGSGSNTVGSRRVSRTHRVEGAKEVTCKKCLDLLKSRYYADAEMIVTEPKKIIFGQEYGKSSLTMAQRILLDGVDAESPLRKATMDVDLDRLLDILEKKDS